MPNLFPALPDGEINLHNSRDFVLNSALSRRALLSNEQSLPILLNDLLDAIYRLAHSCHMPEFTDHGLPHLCSLVDRISRWELPPGDPCERAFLHEELSPSEAAILLLATLVHDIGMLSQNPIDLPTEAPDAANKALWSDISGWVRHTHVLRLERIVRRLLVHVNYAPLVSGQLFATAIAIAQSHQSWPWQWVGEWASSPRLRGLAAVLAVADLLDEDSDRCDTTTLLQHREGNELNRAHWLRHALTTNRILVEAGQIWVDMIRPPDTSDALRPVFSALRNHFRLVGLYDADLQHLSAPITNISLSPSTGIPQEEVHTLANWHTIHGFATESALAFQLLRTFFPEVLKDSRRCSTAVLAHLRQASLEDVDLTILESSDGVEEPRTEVERTFAAMEGASDSP